MEMLEELLWDTLEQRRLKGHIIFIGYRITHKLVMIPSDQLTLLKPSKDTNRGHNMKYCRMLNFRESIFYYMSREAP